MSMLNGVKFVVRVLVRWATQESSKSSSKTVARLAVQKRRCELEEDFNNSEDVRQERVRTIRELGDEYLASYAVRNPESAVFAKYAVAHVQRLLGARMLVDVNEQTVKNFRIRDWRRRRHAKTIKEEAGFLTIECKRRLLCDAGGLKCVGRNS